MTEIVDYGQFCKLLNPGKVDEWDNELNLVENLSVDKIQSEIYELLYRSDTPEKLWEIIVEYIYNQSIHKRQANRSYLRFRSYTWCQERTGVTEYFPKYY